MSAEPQSQRRQVLFAGRVQGVGFRATTRDIARRFQVVGFVRNLPNGTVELVVEGAPEELDRFVAAIGAEMGRCIASQQSYLASPSGEFVEFVVSH